MLVMAQFYFICYKFQPEDKKKSVREQFLKGISESERKGKMLKEEQKQMKENVAAASKQVRKGIISMS